MPGLSRRLLLISRCGSENVQTDNTHGQHPGLPTSRQGQQPFASVFLRPENNCLVFFWFVPPDDLSLLHFSIHCVLYDVVCFLLFECLGIQIYSKHSKPSLLRSRCATGSRCVSALLLPSTKTQHSQPPGCGKATDK